MTEEWKSKIKDEWILVAKNFSHNRLDRQKIGE